MINYERLTRDGKNLRDHRGNIRNWFQCSWCKTKVILPGENLDTCCQKALSGFIQEPATELIDLPDYL